MHLVSRPLFFTRASLLTLAALALLSGCSTNFFGGRHTEVDQGPVVEGHPLILPPDFALRPPVQAADYEASLPKDHFGARTVARGQRTIVDATTVTSATVATISESVLSTAPALANPAGTTLTGMGTTDVTSTRLNAPLSTTSAGLDPAVAAPVSGTDDMQAAIARDTAQEKADNNGFFHKYFGWLIPSHGKK